MAGPHGTRRETSPNGGRRRRRARVHALCAFIAVFALVGWGLAFDPPVGTELMLADDGGRTLIGYGLVEEGGLRLELSSDTRELRVIVVGPDGEARTYRGILADGRLELLVDGSPSVDVADALAERGRSLTLALPNVPEVLVTPRGRTAPAVADEGEREDEPVADRPARDEPAAAASGGAEDDDPGRSDDAPGRSGDAPGRSGDAPGNSDDAPGRSDPPARPGNSDGDAGGGDSSRSAPGDALEDVDDTIDLIGLAEGAL